MIKQSQRTSDELFSRRVDQNTDFSEAEGVKEPGKIKYYAGQEYKLVKISSDTPILFQWFICGKEHKYGENSIPILNTIDHPYLDNIKQAAKIESGRTICLFMGGVITTSQKNALLNLEEKIPNIKVVFCDEVNFKEYDKKWVDIYESHVSSLGDGFDENKKSYIRTLKKWVDNNENKTLLSYHDEKKYHSWFDLYRNLLLLKGCRVFKEINKKGCQHLDSNLGFIYLDVDMILIKKFDDIYLPDGIGVFVEKNKEGDVTMENGIIAVDRASHPALLKGLNRLHTRLDSHPYYDGVCRGIKEHFGYNPESHDYAAFANFVRFDDKCLETDTSKLTSSSW